MGKLLEGIVLEMPRLGAPIYYLIHDRIGVSPPVRSIRAVEEGLEIVAEGLAYLLGPNGMLFRLA